MYVYPFEKLDVWQQAKNISIQVYQITKDFPESEKFGLVNQMRRSAISVCSNLAEGSACTSAKDQAHFYTLAYSSLIELLNQHIISEELKFIDRVTYQDVRKNIESNSLKIYALRKSVLNK